MINVRRKSWVGCLLVVVGALLAGCGGGGNQEVKGNVTFEGQPVTDGQVVFTSDAATIGGEIKEGKFTLQAPPGKYQVKITATREEGVAADGLPNFVMYIPKKYNEQTTLEKEVTAGGANEFSFELTK